MSLCVAVFLQLQNFFRALLVVEDFTTEKLTLEVVNHSLHLNMAYSSRNQNAFGFTDCHLASRLLDLSSIEKALCCIEMGGSEGSEIWSTGFSPSPVLRPTVV